VSDAASAASAAAPCFDAHANVHSACMLLALCQQGLVFCLNSNSSIVQRLQSTLLCSLSCSCCQLRCTFLALPVPAPYCSY
jgi:hypothetical protein